MNCPQCQSDDTRFREKRKEWICEECDHRWSADSSDQSPAGEESQEKVKLFLSYGRCDAKGLADRLCIDLAAAGYDVWQDTREITTGTDWQQEIVDGLRSAQVVIGLLSPHSVRSGPTSDDDIDSVCLGEISYALYNPPPRPVVPVMAAQCEPPLCIFHLDYTDMTAWQESDDQYQAGLKRLLDGIEAASKGEKRYRKWYHQLNPWDFAPFLYEKRHGFVGRKWLFDEIDAWRAGHQESALLVTGDPGTGKSAVVAQLVHNNPHGQVIAYHCCQADTKETLQPWRFVRSVAAMIASKLPEYAAQLDNPDIQQILTEESCQRDPGSALERGVLTPLQAVPAPEEGVRYILVDALDEALTLDSGSNTIVRLLSTRLNRLPPWLRIVATTRNEPDVIERLSTLRAKELDAADPRNLEDIDRYIVGRLKAPNLAALLAQSGTSAPAVAVVLREKSEGNFLYVRQALDALDREQYRFDRLDELPHGLGDLYLVFFERNFPDETSFQSVQRLLEVVVAAAMPLTRDQLADATGLEPRRELTGVLRKLSAYVPARSDAEGTERYSVYHKSLADWLTDPKRVGAAHSIDPLDGHRQLCAAGMSEFTGSPKSISLYYLAHLPAHLIAAEHWDELETLLCDLRFIQAKCTHGMTFDLVRDYSDALNAMPAREAEREQQRRRQDSLRQYGQSLIRYAREHGQGCSLPDPPDTAGAREIMRGANEASQAGGGRVDHRTSDARVQSDSPVVSAHMQLRSFSVFVSRDGHKLNRFPQETLAIARNSAASGCVVDSAERLLDCISRPWISQERRQTEPPQRNSSVRTIEAHPRRVTCVAASPDGSLVVSGGRDCDVRVWDLETGEVLQVMDGHTRAVTSVAVAATGDRAVSVSEDSTVRVWDVQSGDCCGVLEGHADWIEAVAMTPDGRWAVSGGIDRTIRLWDLGQASIATVIPLPHLVTSLALTPDVTYALYGTSEGTVHLLDLRLRETLPGLAGHNDAVKSVAMTPDGLRAISASVDSTLRLWDLSSGRCLGVLKGHSKWVESVAITPDGRLAVSGGSDRMICVWCLESKALMRTLEGHSEDVKAVALSVDGRYAVSGGWDRTIRVWDLHGEAVGEEVHKHRGKVNCVTTTSDGKCALSSSEDGTLSIWDTQTGEQVQTLVGHGQASTTVQVSPDGRIAISGGADGNLILWATGSGRRLRTLKGHTRSITGVAFSPDGRLVVSGSRDTTVRVWDVGNGQLVETLSGRRGGLTCVAIAPQGTICVSGGHDRELHVWDMIRGKLIGLYLTASWGVTSMAIAPDGKTLVAGYEDGEIMFWDLIPGDSQRPSRHDPRFRQATHSLGVSCVHVTVDGEFAVSGSKDGSLCLWELKRQRLAYQTDGHGDPVSSVTMTLEGDTFISGGMDGTIRAWNLSSGRCECVYCADSAVTSLSQIQRDGRFLAGLQNGEVRSLTLQPQRSQQTDLNPLLTAVRGFHYWAPSSASAIAGSVRETELGRGELMPCNIDERAIYTCAYCQTRSSFADPARTEADCQRDGHDVYDLLTIVSPAAEPSDVIQLTCPHCLRYFRLNPYVCDTSGLFGGPRDEANVLDDDSPNLGRREANLEKRNFCQECGEKILDGPSDAPCEKCGAITDFEGDTISFCSVCGKPVLGRWRFCIHCGGEEGPQF